MELVTSISVLLATTFGLVLLWLGNQRKVNNFPRGPSGLVILKNLQRLVKHPHLMITQWAKEYGVVFSLRTGIGNDMVFINDVKLVKELFSEYSASGRDQHPIIRAFGGGVAGIVNTEGLTWEEQRRFTMRTLRHFGLGTALEGLIMDEVQAMLNFFGKRVGQTIPGNGLFSGAVVNSLWNIVAGERFEWDVEPPPPNLLTVQKITAGFTRVGNSGLYFAPWLRHIAPGFFGFTDFLNAIQVLSKSTKAAVKRHVATFNPESPRDFIDTYLNEIEKTSDTDSSFYASTGHANLEHDVFDLLFAGSETTSTTLTWIMLILSIHPEIQEKIQHEIDDVVGSAPPSLSDRSRLPYCQAVILETLRYAPIFPCGAPHRMLQDAVFQGHSLPKGCIIFANVYGIHRNPDNWNNPDEFIPERFLIQNGTQIFCSDEFIPFSIGKRQCIGESLAKDTLFLFLTNIFQKFKVSREPNSSQGLDATPGFMMAPEPFNIIVTRL